MPFLIIHSALKKFRKKSRIKLLLFLVYTQISHVQQAQVTRACYISLTRKKPDLLAGLVAIRKMHIRVMEETELMPADEMLYPENYWFLADVLSYVAVGARSVEDQQHRLTVSGMDVPARNEKPYKR